MDIDLSPPMRKATARDWRQVAEITADAFRDDPVMTYVMGPHRAKLSALRVMARAQYTRYGMCHLYGADGATMWIAHDVSAAPSTLSMLQFAAGMAVHGRRGALKRATAAMEVMDSHHPKAPHLYLFTIGTRASARGQGIGKALLAPVLAACDRDRRPVYLENSNPTNTGFYRAHGFETMGTFQVGAASPVMEPMWREPG